MHVLFDTDIGSDIDDALALLLLRIPEVHLVGITTVYGNTGVRSKVAQKILQAAGCSAPVFVGHGTPLESPMPVWHAGTEGKGVLTNEEQAAPLETMGLRTGAVDFIIEAAEKYPGQLILVSLGALTNVARALRKKPCIRDCIGQLFFMGGGITYKNPVPAPLQAGHQYIAKASHNVRCDVKAAEEVFSSGIPMTMLTNDVTTRVWWDGSPVQQLIAATAPPDAMLVGKLLDTWLTYRTRIFERPITGTCPHDPLTIAEVAGQSFVNYARGVMTVYPDATTSFILDKQGPHRAGVEVDAEGFLRWFSSKISKGTDESAIEERN